MHEKIVKWRTHKLNKQQQLRKEVNRLNHQQMILSLTEKSVNPISRVDYSVIFCFWINITDDTQKI